MSSRLDERTLRLQRRYRRKTKDIWVYSLVSRLSSLVLLILLPAFSHAAEDYFFKANELYDQEKFKEAVPLYRAAID